MNQSICETPLRATAILTYGQEQARKLQSVRRGHLQIELAAEQSDVFVRKIEMKLLLSYQSARESL